MSVISLIVGLGNPGQQYSETRHNAGFHFIDRVVSKFGGRLEAKSRFKGDAGRVIIGGRQIWCLKPMTFMNLSGDSVSTFASYYRIAPGSMLVAHDELDLEPGIIRLKVGGGPGGHNGIRDISRKSGSPDFWRLRIGIGHPGSASKVTGYVLKIAPLDEQTKTCQAIENAVGVIERIVDGEQQSAMNELHRKDS